MFALIAPSVRGSLITIALNNLPTAAPKGLECRADGARGAIGPLSSADALYLCALVVMRDEAAAVVVLNLYVVFVAPDAVYLLWRGELVEEGSECRERLRRDARYAGQDIRVQGLGWDGGDVCGKSLNGGLGRHKGGIGGDRG